MCICHGLAMRFVLVKATPAVQKTFKKKEEPAPVVESKPEKPEEDRVTIDQMSNDDSLEINFFQSANDLDDDFNKDIFNDKDTLSIENQNVGSSPVQTPVSVAPVTSQPVISNSTPSAAPVLTVQDKPNVEVKPVMATPVVSQPVVSSAAPVSTVQEKPKVEVKPVTSSTPAVAPAVQTIATPDPASTTIEKK